MTSGHISNATVDHADSGRQPWHLAQAEIRKGRSRLLQLGKNYDCRQWGRTRHEPKARASALRTQSTSGDGEHDSGAALVRHRGHGSADRRREIPWSDLLTGSRVHFGGLVLFEFEQPALWPARSVPHGDTYLDSRPGRGRITVSFVGPFLLAVRLAPISVSNQLLF